MTAGSGRGLLLATGALLLSALALAGAAVAEAGAGLVATLALAGAALAIPVAVGGWRAQAARRRAEREVVASRSRFDDVSGLISEWVWETDADLKFSFLSARLEDITGIPTSTFVGRARWEVARIDDQEKWRRHREDMQAHRPIDDFEYAFRGDAGQTRTFRISGRPVHDVDGVFKGYRGIGTDVTREVATRREIAEKQSLLETILESMTQGISVVGSDLRTIAFNQRFLQLLDFPAERFRVGDPFERFVRFNAERGEYGDGDVETTVASLVERARQFEPHHFQRTRPDGTVLEISGRPMPTGGFVTTYTDVTERHLAERGLRESESRTREVIDRNLDGFVSVDANGVIIDWNPAAETIFGWSRDQAIGENFARLMPQRYRRALPDSRLGPAASEDDTVTGRYIDIPAARADGSRFLAEVMVSRQRFDGWIALNLFVRDITDRKQAEEDLRQAKVAAEVANRAKTEFLANMSHELRTPLNAVIGFADLLIGQKQGPLLDTYRRYAQDIRDSGEHLLTVIDDILDITRVEAGRFELQIELVDLHDVVDSCFRLLSQRAMLSEVTLVNLVPKTGMVLSADRQRVRQMLINLIGNAVKFSSGGGSVEVRARSEAAGITIEVVDHGIGMEQSDVARAFEPFEQIHSGLNRKFEGSGLGLALVRRFAEMHGATVRLNSRPNVGTTATVVFHRDRKPGAPAGPTMVAGGFEAGHRSEGRTDGL